MNSDLNNFFNEERKRVFEPGPFFAQRVLAQLRSVRIPTRVPAIWDTVPAATKPVFAIALMLLFAVLAVQLLIPIEPTRGAVEAYVTVDLTPTETLLLTGADAPFNAAQILDELTLEPSE